MDFLFCWDKLIVFGMAIPCCLVASSHNCINVAFFLHLVALTQLNPHLCTKSCLFGGGRLVSFPLPRGKPLDVSCLYVCIGCSGPASLGFIVSGRVDVSVSTSKEEEDIVDGDEAGMRVALVSWTQSYANFAQ